MSLAVDLAIEDRAWETVADLPPLVETTIARAHAVSGFELAEGAEVSVLLCDDATIRELNRTWRSKDTATNVLSFPAASPLRLASRPLLGDIAIAYGTTKREAEQDGKALADHLSHLLTHGFLHLLGYDHETPAEAEAMEALEARVLRDLGIGDPYADTEPLPAGAA